MRVSIHITTLLFLSFTTCCQSSNGNIAVTLFKSHIQYLLFFQLQLERNVNKPYKPYRALTPCHCAAGFYPGFCEATHGERLKLMPLKSSQFKSISYLFSPKSQCLSGTYKSAECMAPSVLRPSAFSLLKLGAWHGKLPLASETCKQVIVAAFEIWRGTGWMFYQCSVG